MSIAPLVQPRAQGLTGSSTEAGMATDPLREVSQQLEAVFLQTLFEEMAKTVGSNELFPEAPGRQMYEQWFRREVASDYSSAGGVGLADMVYAQLSQDGGPTDGMDPTAVARTVGDLQHGGDLDVVWRQARAAGTGGSGSSGGWATDRGQGHGRTGVVPAEGRLTSQFGHRTHPVTGHADFHRGVDLAVPVGSAVRSPFAGTVVEVGEDPHLGRFVKVEHAGGYRSLFAHLSRADVAPGAWVGKGEKLAESGNTGRTTGPHLHYGLYRDGEPVDPSPYLSGLSDGYPPAR